MWPDCPHMHKCVTQHARHMPHASAVQVWKGMCNLLHAHMLVVEQTRLPWQLHPRLLPSAQAALLYSADIASVLGRRAQCLGCQADHGTATEEGILSRFNALEHAKGIAARAFRIVLADSGMGQSPSSMLSDSLFSRPAWLVHFHPSLLLQEAVGAGELRPAR